MPFHEDGSNYTIEELIKAAGLKPRNRKRATTGSAVRRSKFTTYQGYTGPVRVTVPWKEQLSRYMQQKIAERSLVVRFGDVPLPPERTKREWFDRHKTLR